MEEKIKLARYKKTPYSVRFEGKRYEWGGSKGKQYSIKEVPPEVVDYLSLNTTALKNGELVILDIESNENAKEIIDNMLESDSKQYEINSITKDEIINLLQGNYKKMEKELNKITSQSTKEFVLQVAKEIKIDSLTKQKILKNWIGSQLSVEELFGNQE